MQTLTDIYLKQMKGEPNIGVIHWHKESKSNANNLLNTHLNSAAIFKDVKLFVKEPVKELV